MGRGLRRIRLVAIAAVLGLGLAGCGGGGIKNADTAGKGDCGDLRIAVNPWTGYVTNAHIIGYVAKTRLGCNVTYPDVKEEVGWAGMASGSIDTIVENWGHPDLVKKYIDEQKTVVDAGPTGSQGIIGWYVPPWMAKKYPDITNWKNLNKYASLFKTSESGGKGQLLDGDPSYVTNDEALVKNLKLNYKVVVGGSEAGLIQSFKSAEKNKTALLAYFYEPQWFFSEMKLVTVDLPPYKPGCDADGREGRLRLPAVQAEQADRHEVLQVRVARRGPDQELQDHQRPAERGLHRHRPERDVAGRRRQEVGGRQQGNGRRLAEVARGRNPRKYDAAPLAP